MRCHCLVSLLQRERKKKKSRSCLAHLLGDACYLMMISYPCWPRDEESARERGGSRAPRLLASRDNEERAILLSLSRSPQIAMSPPSLLKRTPVLLQSETKTRVLLPLAIWRLRVPPLSIPHVMTKCLRNCWRWWLTLWPGLTWTGYQAGLAIILDYGIGSWRSISRTLTFT